MAGVLESVGYTCAEDPSDADVLIYNTCSIREKAELKLYSALGKQVREGVACLLFNREETTGIADITGRAAVGKAASNKEPSCRL